MRQSNQKQKKRFFFFWYLTVKDKSTPSRAYSQLTFPANNKYAVYRAYIMIKAKILLWKTTKTAKKVPEISKYININT